MARHTPKTPALPADSWAHLTADQALAEGLIKPHQFSYLAQLRIRTRQHFEKEHAQ